MGQPVFISMKTIKKYLTIFKLLVSTRLSADLSFRVSFLATIAGSFCFIVLYIATLVLLMPYVNFGPWGKQEMWLFLGVFLIFCYTVFYLFWRGLWHFPENVRNGRLDFYLTKPLDSQFFVSIAGGGLHNLCAMIFGIILVAWSFQNLGLSFNVVNFISFIITLILAILDFYSLAFFFVVLNLRFSYLGEAAYEIWDFQSFSRYPTDAFNNVPLIGYLIAIPFSVIITIPANTLLFKDLRIMEILVFFLASLIFMFLVRKFWFHELKHYSSASS